MPSAASLTRHHVGGQVVALSPGGPTALYRAAVIAKSVCTARPRRVSGQPQKVRELEKKLRYVTMERDILNMVRSHRSSVINVCVNVF
jgi:hypothetical protein